jgi:hypothetical protein
VFSQTAVDQLGGDADDTLTGTAAGDDTFMLDRRSVKALGAGFKNRAGLLARIDGGTGFGTLELSGADITLDLGVIANPGGSKPGSASCIEAIERIDASNATGNQE